MCGEMAGEPLYALVLCGLGLDELSMNPTSIPVVKQVLRGASLAESRRLLEEVMQLSTADEIERRVTEVMRARFPDDLLRSSSS